MLALSFALSFGALAGLIYRGWWRRRYRPPRVAGAHRRISGRVVAPGRPGDVVLRARRGRLLEDAWLEIERDDHQPGCRTTVQVAGPFVAARLRQLRVGERLTMHAVDLPLRGEGHYRQLPVRWGLSALTIARGSYRNPRALTALTLLLLVGAVASASVASARIVARGQCAEGQRQVGGPQVGQQWCERERERASDDKRPRRSVREGPYYSWHPNGELSLEGVYARDKRVGYWTSYDRLGQVRAVWWFEHGRKRRLAQYNYRGKHWRRYRSWDPNGRPHGTWKLFGDNDKLWKLRRFEHGLQHGESVYYDRFGRITRREHHRRGQLHGLRERWRDGVLIERSEYVDGRRHGRFTSWYASGRIERQGDYSGDQRVGVWRWWYRSGRLRARGSYKGGRLHGRWDGWHRSGQRQVSAVYQAGERKSFEAWPDALGRALKSLVRGGALAHRSHKLGGGERLGSGLTLGVDADVVLGTRALLAPHRGKR